MQLVYKHSQQLSYRCWNEYLTYYTWARHSDIIDH